MRNFFSNNQLSWLGYGLALLGVLSLTLSLANASPARAGRPIYKPTKTPTPTLTPTPTPTPMLEACQVVGIIFDQESYAPGETVNVTVRVGDSNGNPLAGAKVVAEVNRRSLDAAAQESTGFGLIDRTGDYDGVYDQTDLPGFYDFEFTASDPTGERFLPCSSQATILIEAEIVDEPACTVDLVSNKTQYQLNEPVTLSATVLISNVVASSADVTGTVERPDSSTDGPFDFSGNNPFTAMYNSTDLAGSYVFDASASSPDGSFSPCSANPISVEVVDLPETALVRVEPESLSTTLCSLQETTAINVGQVSNLAGVALELSYDPTVVQVIDGNAGQLGVQVRVGSIFATGNITQNDVDTRRGRIAFSATRLSGFSSTDPVGLIAIDWRPQRVGQSALTIEQLTLTDDNGQAIVVDAQDGLITVGFVPNCRVVGSVTLQGRTSHDQVAIANSGGEQTQTQVDGSYALGAENVITFEFPGYLSTQIDLTDKVEIIERDGETVVVGEIHLLAGDVNGDDLINIQDLAYIAGQYLSDDPTADINGDGQVDIIDLASAAGNFRMAGPVIAWK